jgi:hypothetical protein
MRATGIWLPLLIATLLACGARSDAGFKPRCDTNKPASNISKAGVDLWLSGHTHRFQRVDPVAGQNTYPLIIGSTDTITRADISKTGAQVTVVKQNGEVLLAPLKLERRRRDRQPTP